MKRIALRALIILILLSVLLIVSSTHAWDKPVVKDMPLPSELGRLHNLYIISGGPYGEVGTYIEDHPEYAPYITGEKEIPSGWHQTGQN